VEERREGKKKKKKKKEKKKKKKAPCKGTPPVEGPPLVGTESKGAPWGTVN